MKFQDPLQVVTDEPLFETGLLLAREINPAQGLNVAREYLQARILSAL